MEQRKKEKLGIATQLLLSEGAANNMYWEYKKAAKQLSRVFEISKEEFMELIDKTCHYCGAGPTQWSYGAKNVHGDFVYTGIDRKDNSKGYITGNVLTCCKMCNYAKHGLSYEEFMAYLDRLVAHRT